MFTIQSHSLTLTLNDTLTGLASLKDGDRELLSDNQPPLFLIRARDEKGTAYLFAAPDADASLDGDRLTYRFPEMTLFLTVSGGETIQWHFAIENHSALAVEFLDLPGVSFRGLLRENGGDCAIVSSYNEGLLVEDWYKKTSMTDPEYPSLGGYMMYPYMLSSPLTMWLYGKNGLAMYVQDEKSGPKGLDFCCSEGDTLFRCRLFLGGEAGGNMDKPVTIVWSPFVGDWQDGAELYRKHVYENLQAKPLAEISLPDWYKNDMPLVITYPVRGIHDMDKMTPNKLFPYPNVLPLVDEFAERTGSRIMVLLMHWEGTAPWAPPYVYPPYGGEEGFLELMDKLHRDGNLLGVYCSGLGFTEQSNLIATYNCADAIRKGGLDRGFCRAPDQSLPHSRICTGQRSGYDICPASTVGRDILDEALAPLLASGVDYVQALDQNHGGGMYFCYGRDHGHPPVPGDWMTTASLDLLDGWKDSCPNTLLGCESAAAEPYIRDLRLSDNRYELCYVYGKPIPLYAYLYHRYLHNFMGNQVSCPIAYTTEGLCARIAYSFAAGDMITLVLNDDGEIMFHWGMRDFSRTPDRDTIIGFCGELHKWHRIYPALFQDGEMVKPVSYHCDTVDIPLGDGGVCHEGAVFSTAWRTEGKTVQLFVNHTSAPVVVKLDTAAPWRNADGICGTDDSYTVAALSVAAIEYETANMPKNAKTDLRNR